MAGRSSKSRGPRDLGRFFSEAPESEPGGSVDVPRLAREEVDHALRVLRAQEGDRLTAIDGRGRRWPLRVRSAGRRELDLEPAGEPSSCPPPGAPGAALPRIRVAVALPRSGRLEPMLDRLTQLGVAEIQPLRCAWTGPGDRWPRRDRLERVLREAVKQSGRSWLPLLADPVDLADWTAVDSATPLAVLVPGAERRLADWARDLAAEGPPALDLAIGPEGGLREEELDRLASRGAVPVRLGPHILRIETAAEAATAVLVAVLGG